MRVCSLFSGIGGIDLGFIQAGFEIVWANEYDEDAAKTYRYNFKNSNLVVKNIKKVNVDTIPDFDVLVAGFPCQPFSSAGMQKGFHDTRGTLFFEIVRVVEQKRPKVVFLENVANLLGHDDGKTFLTIYNALVPYGYSFKYQIMDALDYGNIPQRRSRIFIVAFLDVEMCERFKFPEKVKRTVNLNDILVRKIKHDSSYYFDSNDKYFEKLSRIVNSKTVIYRFYDSIDVYKSYRVCPTLLASMGKFPDSIPVVLDDYGIRRITPYECLALQGFPKDYRFPNIPMASAYKQCGNSVVVPVIRRIAEQIKKVME
ncbi:MAG: DNA cytosine methyltransferase [Faecousia sp.]